MDLSAYVRVNIIFLTHMEKFRKIFDKPIITRLYKMKGETVDNAYSSIHHKIAPLPSRGSAMCYLY